MGAAKENRDRKHMREVFDRETKARQPEADRMYWLTRLTDERNAAQSLADTQATELAALRAKVAELEAQNATLAVPPQPLLYLHGADDGCMGAWLAAATPAVLTAPGSRAEIVEGAGHFLQLEQPTVVNRAILDFVTES